MTSHVSKLSAANLNRWHTVLLWYFAIFGLASASFMVRLPVIRELLGVSVSTLGLLLFSGAVGSLISLSLVGRVVSRIGTRKIVIFGFTIAMLAFIAQAFATVSAAPIAYAAFAFVGGFVIGATDVSINLDASTVEQKYGRSVLPKMHAAYSVGTLIGAGLGTIATALNFAIEWQVILLCGFSLMLPLIARTSLPAGNGIEVEAKVGSESADDGANGKSPQKHTLTIGLVLLGLGIFGMTLGEGSSNDWLTLAIVDDYKESDTVAGIAYAVLLAAMAVTRFFGGNLADRFGKANTLRLMALLGITGILLIISQVSVLLALAGAALWGCGVALAFPLFISAAGKMPNPARKVAFVSASGYMAFLVGPPLLGFLGEAWGLLNMYWVITLFFVLTFAVSAAAGNKKARKVSKN